MPCSTCDGTNIKDSCVLKLVCNYFKEQNITLVDGAVIARELKLHMNQHETFLEYYELFKKGHECFISMNVLLKKLNTVVHDPEFIGELIPIVCKSAEQKCKNEYVIDVQGFKISATEFVIREFCVSACDGTLNFHCLVKLSCEYNDLPFTYQKQVDWLTSHLHGFAWNSSNGYTVSHIQHVLFQCCPSDAMFYCKGAEKAVWLRKLFHIDVFDIAKEHCPALNELNFKISCSLHESIVKSGCAFRNCQQLVYWYVNIYTPRKKEELVMQMNDISIVEYPIVK